MVVASLLVDPTTRRDGGTVVLGPEVVETSK